MNDSPQKTEAADISIQTVTADSMQVNVNGEVKEIKNNLDELKSLLQNLSAENFKSGDKIYNIGSITNATFSAEIGKKTFNMYLCRKLTEAISDYNDDARNFLKRYKDVPNWETQDRYASRAKECIVSGFVGVLGMLLRKVMAIGIESFDATSSRKYIKMCIATATSTLQLLSFAFISMLWDHKKENNFEFTAEQADILDNFFETEIELNIPDYVKLLQMLINIFNDQKIAFPFSEFDKDCFRESSSLNKTCKNLDDIENKLDSGQIVYSTAFEAENELTGLLCALSFLANYKMVSIKEITYNDIRNAEVKYLHSYTFLDGNTSSSKYKYDARPVSNDAVLIYKDTYQQGVNLFPFIIDANALNNVPQARICFFTYYEERKKKITYADIDKIGSDKGADIKDKGSWEEEVQFDDYVERDLAANVEQDITALMQDKFKNLQSNMVYKIFQTAQKEILA